MTKINGCLKCLFIFFNVFFMVIGALMVFGAVKSAYQREQLEVTGISTGWIWVFPIGILACSIFGIVAVCMEKELLLKVFAGLMTGGMVLMLIFGIIMVSYRNKLKNGFDAASSEFAESFMKQESFTDFLEAFQGEGKCCGMVSYKDWGTKIPDSCACNMNCQPLPAGYTGPDEIFRQSCGGLLFSILDILFQVSFGIFFGFAVIALLGLLVSLLMIWQVRRYDSGSPGQSMAMKG